eukprot:TRINITY_DN121154_c0_g1_i1.p1 TRINITY_DN121154_c0_g1~~TRINITY_DN121154_c0_g1_i1.p1  ORF type:complete len:564 (+),score=73.61 TRINITY_DN121154_c0_g1_i1:97-1788(+)
MKEGLKFSSLNHLLHHYLYKELTMAFIKRKYVSANGLAEKLCDVIKKEHFGDKIYQYALKTRCLCLYKLNKTKEAEMHLRNVAEFVLADPHASADQKLDALQDLLKHSLNYSVLSVLLQYNTDQIVRQIRCSDRACQDFAPSKQGAIWSSQTFNLCKISFVHLFEQMAKYLCEKSTFVQCKENIKDAIKDMKNPLNIGIALHNLAVVNYHEIQAHNDAVLHKQKVPTPIIETEDSQQRQDQVEEIKKKHKKQIQQLQRKTKLHPNKIKDCKMKKSLRTMLEKQASLDKLLKRKQLQQAQESAKYEILGKTVVNPLEGSTLPQDNELHPINSFPSPVLMDDRYTISKQIHEEGVIPVLFPSLWLQERGLEKMMKKQKSILDIKVIDDLYKKDSAQNYLESPFSVKTCLFLGELYLTHSQEIETIRYWLTYGEKLAEKLNFEEDASRAKALIAADCIETGDYDNAVFILERMERNKYREKSLVTLAMIKALLGIALREIDPNKSAIKIEEAKELKKKTCPADEKRIQMILPKWTMYTSKTDLQQRITMHVQRQNAYIPPNQLMQM